MELEHDFTVPVGVAQAWEVLLDVPRIAPCLPGATLTGTEGEEYTGTVKVKVGPITVSYAGRARFLVRDEAERRVVLEAQGKETRGAGTAAATVTATLHPAGEGTRVLVHTDLSVTGRPAQFGRGVMNEVSGKLLGQFAACLADQLAGGAPPAAPGEVPGGAPAASPTPGGVDGSAGEPPGPVRAAGPGGTASRPTPEAIDLLGTVGVPLLRRLAPALLALAAFAAVIAVARRRRR